MTPSSDGSPRSRRDVSTPEIQDALLLTILDGLPVAVMLRAQDGWLLHANPSAEQMLRRLGLDTSDVAPSPSSLLDHVEVIDEDGSPHRPEDLPVVSALREETSRDATLGYRLPDGGLAWYSVRAAPVTLEDGSTGTVVTCDDVTERHEARHRVAVAERSLRLTFHHAPIGIAVLAPEGEVLQVNAALCDLLGYDEEHLLAGGLQAAAHPDERGADRGRRAAWIADGDAERYLVERRFVHASGRVLSTQLSVALVRDDDGTPLHLIVQIVDVTAQRALEQELRAAAVEDPLTGLANRRALVERLAELARQRARDGRDIGLVYLDLDGFKRVNDDHGHDAGDRVLVEMGRQLLGETREVDTVCRMGGDEFVILCASVDGVDGLAELTDRLERMPPSTVEVDGSQVAVGRSVGAVLVEEGEELDQALRRADAAMYRAKRTSEAGPPDVDAGAPRPPDRPVDVRRSGSP